jgi:hypothetical protein
MCSTTISIYQEYTLHINQTCKSIYLILYNRYIPLYTNNIACTVTSCLQGFVALITHLRKPLMASRTTCPSSWLRYHSIQIWYNSYIYCRCQRQLCVPRPSAQAAGVTGINCRILTRCSLSDTHTHRRFALSWNQS